MISEGRHPAVVVPVTTKEGTFWCQFGESGQKKTPFVAVQFEILRGPDARRRITWYGYLPEDNHEAGDRTLRGLRACGFTGDDLAAFLFQEVNQECSLDIEHEEYQGKRRARVQWVNAVGGGGLKAETAMKESQLRLFAARLKSRVAAAGVVRGPEAIREEPTPRGAGEVDRGGGYDQSAGDGGGYGGGSDRAGAPPDDERPSLGDDDIPF